MNIRRHLKISSRIELTSAVDIIFLLVIFFMVSSTFIKELGIKVDLPSSKTADAQPTKDIVISVTRTGAIYINKQAVSLDDLPAVLARKLEEENRDMVVIKADRETSVQLLLNVMDAARGVGITRINISTDKE